MAAFAGASVPLMLARAFLALCLTVGALGSAYAQPFSLYRPNDTSVPLCSNATIPAGNTVTNTAAETPFASTCLVPAYTLRPGVSLILLTSGRLGVSAVVPTLRGRIKATGNGVTVLLVDTGAQGGLTAGTNLRWSSQTTLIVQSGGTDAARPVDVQGSLLFQTAATAAISVFGDTATPGSAPTAAVLDTTVDQVISYTGQWSAASTDNYIQIRQFVAK